MTPNEYQTLRNELIEHLQQAIAFDSINEETRNRLKRICKGTLESQFDIVLVGEFQGGKSTTFNAFCDGRELSPTGSGMRTSGCIVAAQNISDHSEPEKAIVEWRSSDELIAGFSDLLLPHLKNLDSERFENITASELGKIIKLDSETDRHLVKEAANQEWEIWEKDKSGYDLEQKGNLDVLRLASIVAHHYASDTINQLWQQHEFSPEVIGSMIVFPSDWDERWTYNDPAKFDSKEIVFAFIKNVRIRLHFNYLSRLGCVIIDCPGLFASRWDTEVARSAMFNADAILYLFDGNKTIKLSDLKALQFVHQNGMEYKLFYGCNMRGHSLENSKRILQSTAAKMKESDFKVHEDEFGLFHALLALRSIQSERFFNGKLDSFTADVLADKKGTFPENVKKRLRKDIIGQMIVLDIDDDYPEFNTSVVKYAREVSGIDRLMDVIERAAIRKKARKILIDTGSKIAANCLLEAESTLRSRENSAHEKEYEFRLQVETANEELNNFEQISSQIINKLNEKISCRKWMTEDFLKLIEKRQDRFLSDTAKKLYDVHKKSGWIQNRGDSFKNKLIAIIQKETEDFFKESFAEWMATIKDGKNGVYNRELAYHVSVVSNRLNQQWQKVGTSETGLLSGIILPQFTGDIRVDAEIIKHKIKEDELFKTINKSEMIDEKLDNARIVGGVIGGASGLIGGGWGAFSLVSSLGIGAPWISITAGVAASVAGGLVSALILGGVIFRLFTIFRGGEERKIEKLKKAFSSQFSEMYEQVKPKLKHFVEETVKEIITFYEQAFYKFMSEGPRKVFEERKEQAEADFRKSQEKREAIAIESKRIREEKIQPLRIKLQEFVSKVEHHLNV
ncbi:MAG: hypothetical protein GY795_09665 [Desulfobacterales bacterium]|nr:hypothetical protein [Desulfobacterales bacterium]